ncbi:MAG: hypothetical protein J7521_16475 [Caulobacter sp.]|nr:hypothetical protein [Caulobacter sp.]
MATITGTQASDTLTGGTATDFIDGLGGDDYIVDKGGDNDIIRGGAGDDQFWVERSYTGAGGLITLDGGAGDDWITAAGYFHAPAYDWRVDAGDGNDHLELRFLTRFSVELGAGNDYAYIDMPMSGGTISLGSGADRITFASDYGRNPGVGDRYLTISGLTGDDQIDLNALSSRMINWDRVTNLFASGHLRATQSGSDVLIDIDTDGAGGAYDWLPLLRLTDRTLAQLTPLNLSGMRLDGSAISLTYTTTASSYFYFNGSYGNDHLTAREVAAVDGVVGYVSMNGLAGDDVLVANSTGSALTGGDGDDHLIGGAGNDSFEGGSGNDVIEGGGGNHNVLYFVAPDSTGATFVLGQAGPQNTGFGWDTITGVQEVRATINADHLSVDPSVTEGVLFYGGSGDDVLIGGAGDDQLYGEAGDDRAFGGDGNDKFYDMDGGNDVYDGGEGYDLIVYAYSDRGVTVDLTVATPQAGNRGGLDVVLNMEALYGSAYADTLLGTNQANVLWGNNGDDILIGRGGNDELTGGAGNDILDGGDGDDTLIGGFYIDDPMAGDDTLIGGAGFNYLTGGVGRDTFVVGKGHDVILEFQFGTDILSVDNLFVLKVSEKLVVGTDNQVFFSQVYVTLSNGSELEFQRIRASDITNALFTGLQTATLGDVTADTLFGTAAADWIEGQAGADKLSGLGGTDRLSGGDGDDTLHGDRGGDVLSGDAGNDILAGGADADLLSGGDGGDTLWGGDGDDNLAGDDGNDVLDGGLGKDTVDGGAGDDTLILGRDGDILDGAAGSDTLVLTSGFGSYVVTADGDGWTVRSGATSTTVRNVEFVRFDNTTKTWAEFAAPGTINGLIYAASYVDLAKAFATNATLAVQHYGGQGRLEGRAAALFNPLIYAASNSDLTLAFRADAGAALNHYLVQGVYENRPTTGFDPLIYAASNSDLARAFGADATAAVNHYLVQGVYEHRVINSFDPYRYLASNIDLLRMFGADAAAATRHYLIQGVRDGLSWTSFDAHLYAASNPDVAARVGADLNAAARDYVEHGFDSGLAITGFDARAYTASSVDLARAFGLDADAAITHYLLAGRAEGRPTGGFDSVAYLLSNPDLAGRTPEAALTHWLEGGAREGRAGDAPFGRDQVFGHTLTTDGARSTLTEGDRDWFVFQANAGQSLHLSIANIDGGPIGATLAVYNSLGRLAAVDSNADHALDITPTTTGSYYVTIVDGPGAADAGMYALHMDITGSATPDGWLL